MNLMTEVSFQYCSFCVLINLHFATTIEISCYEYLFNMYMQFTCANNKELVDKIIKKCKENGMHLIFIHHNIKLLRYIRYLQITNSSAAMSGNFRIQSRIKLWYLLTVWYSVSELSILSLFSSVALITASFV